MLSRLFAAGVLLALAGHARADALLSFVDAGNGRPQSRIGIAGGRLRIDAAYAPGNGYTVVDLNARTVTQINPGAKATATASIEQLQSLNDGLNGAANSAAGPLVQLALDQLPADQRDQAESLLRQSKRDESIPFRRTAQSSRVAGIPCQVYEQHASSGDLRRLCLARYADLKLSQADTRTLQSAFAVLRETGGPWLPAAQLPGVPIEYSGSLGAPADAGQSTLQSITQDPLPAAFFAAPPAYRLVSIFEMLSLSGGMAP
jgi:hypothetical protein